MASVNFDTLELAEKLKSSDIGRKQAEAVVRNIAEAQESLLTKQDLKETELRLENRFERVDGELKLNRWMLGVLLATVVSLVLKAFF